MISGRDDPPGVAGALVAGGPGTRPNWTIRSCPVSVTQTCPVTPTDTPCGNSRSSPG